MPSPPPSCLVMHCEPNDDDDEDDHEGGALAFRTRRAVLRGGYIILSNDINDESDDGNNNNSKKKTKKESSDDGVVRCIPVEGSEVDLPPGGRRVFREHAHTTARRGYELAIRVRYTHYSDGGDNNDNANDNQDKVYTCYIVLDTLNHRTSWATAIRMRCDVGLHKETLLRPGGIAGGRLLASAEELYDTTSGTTTNTSMNNTSSRMQQSHLKKGKHYKMGIMNNNNSSSIMTKTMEGGSGNTDLNEALTQFSTHKFNQEKWVQKFLQRHAVTDLPTECDKLEKWMDVIKMGLRGAVLEQYEYFVEASREMTKMGREVAFLRTLVERQQECLMGMKNIDFSVGLMELFMENDNNKGNSMMENDEYDSDYDDDNVMRIGGGMMVDGDDDDDVSTSSSEDEGSNTRTTPMKSNLRNNRRGGREQRRVLLGSGNNNNALSSVDEDQGPPSPNHQQSSSYIEIPAWIIDSTEEISSLIKESRYTDAADLIIKAKAEATELLSSQNSNAPVVMNTPASLNSRFTATTATSTTATSTSALPKRLHKKQQSQLQRILVQIDSLADRMSKRLSENLRRKNEALKASAKRERADPLSTLAPLPSPVCLNDDAVVLGLLVKLGRYQEAATAYAARRSLVLSECLHERPISSPIGMDAVIYAAQLSSSFFSALSASVEGFLDLFDSDSGKVSGSDDDTSLNSKSLCGGKKVPSGALSAIVLWCDSEIAKFANVFGSSRLLGSLSLSPPGMRRKEDQSAASRANFAKERESSMEVAAKCMEQAFMFASENLDSIGLPLVQLLGKNMR